MDTAAFAIWLGGIGLLDPAQRAEAFRELALAEADDSIDPSAHPVDAAVLPYEAAVALSLPVAEMDDAAPEEDLMSKVGRGQIARFGCPHCAVPRLAASLARGERHPDRPAGASKTEADPPPPVP